MSKKKGFTLVELLAVIVILAIIALIAIPIILGVIDKARESSFKDSAYGIIDSAELYLAKNQKDEIIKQAKEEDGININELDFKSKNDYIGAFFINEDGQIELIKVHNSNYCVSGTKNNLIIKKDCSKLPNMKLSKPTIVTSDNKLSWHTEAYTVSFESIDSNIKFYYGLDQNNMIEGNSINSGIGISEEGVQTYYVKTCDIENSTICSKVVTYVARIENCNPDATITGNPGTWSGNDVTLTVNPSECESGIKSYKWVDENNSLVGSNQSLITTQTGTYSVTVTYNSGKIVTRSSKVQIDKSVPTVNITASDSVNSGEKHTKAYSISVTGSETPSGTKIYIDTNSNPTKEASALASGVGINLDGDTTYYAKACNGAGICSGIIEYHAILELTPEKFETDSWSVIASAVKKGNHPYKVGDKKCIKLNGFSTTNDNGCSNGEFLVRISNTSSCSLTSQTACGFVVEFVDIITKYAMNSSNTNKGGWQDSQMRIFVNNDIYHALPSDLQKVIIDTIVISGYGYDDYSKGNDYITTDKLYLLTRREVDNCQSCDSFDNNSTRQLDYYAAGNSRIRYYNGSKDSWVLRSAYFSDYSRAYTSFRLNGEGGSVTPTSTGGVVPAFRL